MNADIPTESGQTVRSVVTALSSTPAILAILLFNIVFMGMTAYAVVQSHERWKSVVETVIKYCSSNDSASLI